MNTLIRTQISLYKSQKQTAGRVASWQNVSLAEVLRRALDQYLDVQDKKRAARLATIKRLAGAWEKSPNWKRVDAVAWQRKLRREKGI